MQRNNSLSRLVAKLKISKKKKKKTTTLWKQAHLFSTEDETKDGGHSCLPRTEGPLLTAGC